MPRTEGTEGMSNTILRHIAELPESSVIVLYKVRRAACGVRRAACGVRRAACGVRHAACGWLPVRSACLRAVTHGRWLQNVWTVVAVLRALPPLARQLVMRLAFLDAPADVSPWVASALAEQKGIRILCRQLRGAKGE
jgi:hypothetical protein